MNHLLEIAPQRSLPPFARSLYSQFDKQPATDAPRVILYGDCFVAYNEPHIGLAAVRVLRALGYDVRLPKVGCCGRAMISNGLLRDAIETIDSTLADLKPYIDDPNVRAILVAEPSCLSAFKDDWLQLKVATPLDLRRRLAAKAMLIEEFVDRAWDEHPRRPMVRDDASNPPIVLHGHCHQKALWGDGTSSRALRRFVGETRVSVLDSGCCGMAGSFGYAAHRYDLSMKIGELSLFPPVRSAPADAIIAAPGTSCRHQIHDGTGRRALHPIEVIDHVMWHGQLARDSRYSTNVGGTPSTKQSR